MPRATLSKSISIGDIVLQGSVTRTADGGTTREPVIPAAKPLTSWVKTDLNTAAGNLPAGHGLSDGVFDVYWDVGSRFGVDGTIATNALSLDGGAGDDFPATANATVVVSRRVQINMAIDGDALKAMALKLLIADPNATSDGHALFKDADGDTIADLNLNANEIREWDIEGGATNTFTGDPITVIYASQNNTTYPATLQIGTVEDSTP